ncbi:BOW99_gp33 family protein [Bacillus cereus]|uniref:BOW99_gp33 family protein n=1 Tax=Bacillus cereus TaxID=1396 RepID=UPI0015D46E97|nr:hypothetical protein [Bacillus cereus]
MAEKWNPKVTHIMKDGTVRDSMEGVMIPRENRYYEIMAAYVRNQVKKGNINEAG